MSEQDQESHPDGLLFQSFRHSQGGIVAQQHIFRYLELAIGYQVNLFPSDNDVDLYVRYLETAKASSSTTHIDADLGGEPACNSVRTVFADLREDHDQSAHAELRAMGMDSVTASLASLLLTRENQILNLVDPWTSHDGKIAKRPDRLMARVRAGKASFLLYYGRDMHPTGSDIYNQMYEELWGVIQNWDERLEHLTRVVAEREAQINA